MLLTLTGGAGAGKTTVAALVAAAPPDAAADSRPPRVLHGDDFYFPSPADGGVWRPDEHGVDRLDVGDPRSQDRDRLDNAVADALHTAPLVVVEGLFAHLAGRRGRPVRRLDAYLDAPADLRLARKIHRQCVAGDFPLHILLRNYLASRRAAFARHVEPVRDRADLVLDGTRPPAESAARIRAALATMERPTVPTPPGSAMKESQIIQNVDALVAEEHKLRERAAGEGLDQAGKDRLRELEVNLDQCWDLLRQRRARSEFGENPDDAAVRPAGEVEGYLG